MAGQERSGIEAADVFFVSRSEVCADRAAQARPRMRASASLSRLIEAIGARPLWMDALTHDRAAALVSHLPQLLAVALAGVVREQTDETGLPLTLAGRGLRDALRLAGSPYAVWRDIVLTNSENIEAALDRLIQQIEHLRVALAQPRTGGRVRRRQRGVQDTSRPEVNCPSEGEIARMDKRVADAQAVMSHVRDGAIILMGGFGLCGIPENLIAAVRARGHQESHRRLE